MMWQITSLEHLLLRLAPASLLIPHPPAPSVPLGESAALPFSAGTAGCGRSCLPDDDAMCQPSKLSLLLAFILQRFETVD